MKKYLLISVFSTLALSWQASLCAAPYIRYEAHTVQGKKAVISMQKALAKLKSIGCTSTVSWYYQSAMHGVPLPGIDGNLATNPLCPSFTSTAKLQVAWAKCASHNESGPPSDIHFLPWHRLYLLHFERIVRKYSGDPKFAMPYWNYQKYPTLPEKFQQIAKGSLYEPARDSSLNQGKPIKTGALAVIRQENAALQDIVDYETYNSQINRGLHDYLHDYIGGTATTYNKVYNTGVSNGLMGNVPSAAFDPIFWVHHSNIDRLWQNWIIENPGQNVTLEQLDSIRWPYYFIKDNGVRISYRMSQVLAVLKKPDYVYDTQVAAPAAKAIPQRLQEHVIASVPLNAVATQASLANITLNLPKEKQLLAKKATNEHVILKLNVAYAGKPNGRYEVYVNLPGHLAATSVEAQKYFAGAISFFVNDPHGKGGAREFRYDITNELATSKQTMQAMHLTIVKTTGDAEGSVTIKNAEVLYLN